MKKKEKKRKKTKTVVVAFKPPDEYPWQGRNSFLYIIKLSCVTNINITFLFLLNQSRSHEE